MFRVALIGHSLLPTRLYLRDLPTVETEIHRYPGATIDDLTARLTETEFWTKRYDGIIVCIGGNDLATFSVDETFDRICNLARRLRPITTFLTFCTIEYRLYPSENRFGIIQREYRRKANVVNRRIKRFMRSVEAKILDLGRRCFTLQRGRDGVHFNSSGQITFQYHIHRVISAFVQR